MPARIAMERAGEKSSPNRSQPGQLGRHQRGDGGFAEKVDILAAMGMQVADDGDDAAALEIAVITSYSIHYTKLYEIEVTLNWRKSWRRQHQPNSITTWSR